LRTEEDTAVISSDLASSRSDFDVGEGEPAIELSGFYEEDPTLPDDLYIEVKDPQSGQTRSLRVIGCSKRQRSLRLA